MSIIVQRHLPDGKKGAIELWFKGADIETYHRLDRDNKLNQFEDIIRERTETLTKQGLRVLLWAKREISKEEVMCSMCLLTYAVHSVEQATCPDNKARRRKITKLGCFLE
jgi:hypothetical protein